MAITNKKVEKEIKSQIAEFRNDFNSAIDEIIYTLDNLPENIIREGYRIEYTIYEYIRGFHQSWGLEGDPIPAGANILLLSILGSLDIYSILVLTDSKIFEVNAITGNGTNISRPYTNALSLNRIINEGYCLLDHCLLLYDDVNNYYAYSHEFYRTGRNRINSGIDVYAKNNDLNNDIRAYILIQIALRQSTIYKFNVVNIDIKELREFYKNVAEQNKLSYSDINMLINNYDNNNKSGNIEIILHKDDNEKIVENIENAIKSILGIDDYKKVVV